MSDHRAEISWRRTTADFTYDSYSRDHDWRFGAIAIAASASPDYRGSPARVDPEEALVAALSSCHMLSFLALAARRRLTVDAYSDAAVGHMEKNAEGRLAITRVVLRPRVTWAPGVAVADDMLEKLHHQSHRECFIANSVKSEVIVEPQGP